MRISLTESTDRLHRSTLAGALLALTACCVSPPTAEELLAVGFRSPEQAFATYQTAMAGDHLDLEYRCLAPDFKEANGIDGMAYRLGREELFRQQPYAKLLAEGEVIASRPLGPGIHELTVEAGALWVTRHIRVVLTREDFYETWRGSESVMDEFVSFDSHVFVEPGEDGAPDLLYALVDVPPGVDASTLTELRFGREWRIAGFELTTDPDEAAASDTP